MRKASEEIKESREIPQRCLLLSDPETPPEAVLWVLRTGLSPEEAQSRYGMRYDPKTQRVCVPIKDGFIARAVFRERPKYLRCGAGDTDYYLLHVTEDVVVLTEDILSAIKVRSTGYSAVAALGTSVSDRLAQVLSKYPRVICWTDADKAGDKAWVAVRSKMAVYSSGLSRIRTEQDPKSVDKSEIIRLIKEI